MEAEPTPPPLPAPPTAPLAVWSLVLGALSLVCGWLFTGIPAVICGHIARARIRQSNGALGGNSVALVGLILGYIGVAIGLMGLPLLIGMIQSDRERIKQLATETREVASADGKMKVTVPALWAVMPKLNSRATLQVGDKSKEMYLIVITDSKTDLDHFTLEQHHQQTRQHMLDKMKNSSATEPASVTINGAPALQDEISGTQNGTNVVFLHTTVDDGDHFQQILAWTLKSRWAEHREQLHEITGTFRSEK